MPSGKTHAAITAVATGAIAVAMWETGFTAEEIQLASGGCMTGIILSPDLDVDAGFLGHAFVKEYFGKIVGKVWKTFWWPYAVVFHHRSNRSHTPVVSTAGRVLYLYAMYFAVCVDLGSRPWLPDLYTALLLFGGLVVSDTLHYIADIASTSLKKRRRNASLHFPMSEMPRKRRSRARLP